MIKLYKRKDEMQMSRYILFHRVHRLNSADRDKQNQGPKQIVAKFERFSDRKYVTGQAPKTLVNKPFGVREQFPKTFEDKRRQLYPVMKHYRKDKNNKVRLVRDKHYINGYEYVPSDDDQNNVRLNKDRTTITNATQKQAFLNALQNRGGLNSPSLIRQEGRMHQKHWTFCCLQAINLTPYETMKIQLFRGKTESSHERTRLINTRRRQTVEKRS